MSDNGGALRLGLTLGWHPHFGNGNGKTLCGRPFLPPKATYRTYLLCRMCLAAARNGYCVHHWVIAAANGPTAHAFCRYCGAHRQYATGVEWHASAATPIVSAAGGPPAATWGNLAPLAQKLIAFSR